jgi:glycine dehydrogenase subunit 2
MRSLLVVAHFVEERSRRWKSLSDSWISATIATVYFPLVVPEALMIEPTDGEQGNARRFRRTTLIKIKGEDAAFLKEAPHTLSRSRPDEVKAAKEPILRWKPA